VTVVERSVLWEVCGCERVALQGSGENHTVASCSALTVRDIKLRKGKTLML
jgi:hypothetical protein